MKKLIVVLSLSLLIMTGCGTTMNTPTDSVEEFLGRYQKLDKDVLNQLDDVFESKDNMSDEQKKDYRSLMEKQYQNMSYKIKNEEISGDSAVVDVEIEVYDYATTISKAKDYYNEHKEEFTTKETINTGDDREGMNGTNEEIKEKVDDATDTVKDGVGAVGDKIEDGVENIKENILETKAFIDYKIKELKGVTDTIKYDITFNLTKVDGRWEVDDISDIDREKIHGLYEG